MELVCENSVTIPLINVGNKEEMSRKAPETVFVSLFYHIYSD